MAIGRREGLFYLRVEKVENRGCLRSSGRENGKLGDLRSSNQKDRRTLIHFRITFPSSKKSLSRPPPSLLPSDLRRILRGRRSKMGFDLRGRRSRMQDK